ILVDPATDKLLGCHLLGPDTPELIQVMAACMMAGATKTNLDDTFAVHPTMAEELVLFRKPSEIVEGERQAPDPLAG
ncbi:MAG TPA: NADPH-glutathione reductase, partial [Phycisphaerales bacterium]|nr:NADPH-glutathione reductase [Phycisphaerales bacterium]